MEYHNGKATLEEILAEPQQFECEGVSGYKGDGDGWPDSVHHQSWHDAWRDSHSK